MYTFMPVPTIPNAAQISEMSASKGVVYFTPYSVTHVKNNNDILVYIQERKYQNILDTRKAVAELTGIDEAKIRATYAGMGRQVSDWIGVKQPKILNAKALIPYWHYQACFPVQIDDCKMFDMKSAYWQVASRSKSLLVDVDLGHEKIYYRSMTGKQEEKWERTKRELDGYKSLRLALIGVNATGFSSAKSTCSIKGKICEQSGAYPATFQPLALLTVRIAYELTQIASQQSQSWYSNADCVSTTSNTIPFWDHLGIEYRSKAVGSMDLNCIGNYRCGDFATDTYKYTQSQGLQSVAYHAPRNLERPVYHEKFFL